jgi:phosphate transport system permease protein
MPLAKHYRNQLIAFSLIKGITAIVLLILVFIIGYVFVRGIGKVINPEFWVTIPRDALKAGGILPAIMGTIILTVFSILMSCMVGIPAGIYMAEYAPPGRLKSFIDIMTNNLSGIPSIVFGLFGMTLFVVAFGFGDSILAGALTLAIMVLPVIIRTTEEAIKAVPYSLRIASIGMGATKFQTIVRVLLPISLPRVLTGVILGIGRVAGETAPILFTVAALYIPSFPTSAFDQVMALPYHLYILSVSSPEPDKSLPMAFGTALVLLIIVLGMNLIAGYIRRHYAKKFKMN